MAHPLEGVRIKIERAKHHIRDLEAEIQAFHGRNPYRIVREVNAKTGGYIFRLHIDEEVPACLSGIIGDIVHNLRAALDQLAWQLVIANGRQPRRQTAFPLAASAEKFEAEARTKIEGIGIRAYRLIRQLKPYPGGRKFSG